MNKFTTRQILALAISVLMIIIAIVTYLYWTPGPMLTVKNQPIQNGQITIGKINVPKDAWVVLSATKYEQPTEVVGKVRVKRGRHKNIGIYVNVQRTTPLLEAVVYEDVATPGVLDLSSDKPVIVDGKALKLLFNKQ